MPKHQSEPDSRPPNALKELPEQRQALLDQAEQSIKDSGLPISAGLKHQQSAGISLSDTFCLLSSDKCPVAALSLLGDWNALDGRACLDLRIAHRLQDSLAWVTALWRRLQMFRLLSPGLALVCGPRLMHDLERRGIRSALPLDHFLPVPGAAEDTLFLLDTDKLRVGPVDVRQVYDDGSADYYLSWVLAKNAVRPDILPLAIARGWSDDFTIKTAPVPEPNPS